MFDRMQQIRSTLGRNWLPARALVPRAILTVLVAIGATALGLFTVWSQDPEIVARVNGEAVTRSELQRMVADPLVKRQLQQELGGQKADSKELDRLAVRKLILRRLVLQEAGRREVRVTDEDVTRAVADLHGRFKEPGKFSAWLKERGLDDSSLPDAIRTELLTTRVRAVLVEGVRITDEQVKEFYEAHKEELKTAGQVRLRILAVKDKKGAEETLAALRKGQDFARLARERSLFRATQGGDTGWVSPRTLPSPLRETVGTLKAGETRGPLQSGTAFLLVRVEDRRPAQPMSLAEARPAIERRLLAPKQQEMLQAWVTEQEKKAKIEVFL